MKKPEKLAISIISLAIGFNTLCGMLLTLYPWFNVMLVNFSLVLDLVFLVVLYRLQIPDGYKIALLATCIIAIFTKTVIGVLSPPFIGDNPILLIIIAIFLFEVILMIILRFSSRFASIDKTRGNQ